MKYIKVKEDLDLNKTKTKNGVFGRMLTRIFRSKFDGIDEKIFYWWLKVDENGHPISEIAFDKFDKPIWVAPTENERGLYVDSQCLFSDDWKNERNVEIGFRLMWNKFVFVEEKRNGLTKKELVFYKAIDKIFWEDWDPIGVSEHENARDEYYFYLEESFKLALSKDKSELIEHLFNVEKNDMGLSTYNKDRCEKVADLIFEAKNSLGL